MKREYLLFVYLLAFSKSLKSGLSVCGAILNSPIIVCVELEPTIIPELHEGREGISLSTLGKRGIWEGIIPCLHACIIC